MNLDAKALIGFIKEVEDSRTRQKAETEYQRDVFARARKKHFDVKAMRIVLQRRAMEPSKRDEQDYNVDAYEHALGAKKDAIEAMEKGATAREAAKAHKLPRAAVTALKAAGAENVNFEPAHDAETGEITETPGLDTPVGGEGTAVNEAAPALAAVQSCGGELKGPDVVAGSARDLASAGVAPGSHDTAIDDMLTAKENLERLLASKQEGGGLSLPDRREAVND